MKIHWLDLENIDKNECISQITLNKKECLFFFVFLLASPDAARRENVNEERKENVLKILIIEIWLMSVWLWMITVDWNSKILTH